MIMIGQRYKPNYHWDKRVCVVTAVRHSDDGSCYAEMKNEENGKVTNVKLATIRLAGSHGWTLLSEVAQ